jgi:hypothetical protein
MKTSKRIASQAGEQQLAGFIKKFDSKNAALIHSVRKVLRKRLTQPMTSFTTITTSS